jgi:hypothetical protein
MASDGQLRDLPRYGPPFVDVIRYYTSTDCAAGTELGGGFGPSGCGGFGFVTAKLASPTPDGQTLGYSIAQLGAATTAVPH